MGAYSFIVFGVLFWLGTPYMLFEPQHTFPDEMKLFYTTLSIYGKMQYREFHPSQEIKCDTFSHFLPSSYAKKLEYLLHLLTQVGILYDNGIYFSPAEASVCQQRSQNGYNNYWFTPNVNSNLIVHQQGLIWYSTKETRDLIIHPFDDFIDLIREDLMLLPYLPRQFETRNIVDYAFLATAAHPLREFNVNTRDRLVVPMHPMQMSKDIYAYLVGSSFLSLQLESYFYKSTGISLKGKVITATPRLYPPIYKKPVKPKLHRFCVISSLYGLEKLSATIADAPELQIRSKYSMASAAWKCIQMNKQEPPVNSQMDNKNTTWSETPFESNIPVAQASTQVNSDSQATSIEHTNILHEFTEDDRAPIQWKQEDLCDNSDCDSIDLSQLYAPLYDGDSFLGQNFKDNKNSEISSVNNESQISDPAIPQGKGIDEFYGKSDPNSSAYYPCKNRGTDVSCTAPIDKEELQGDEYSIGAETRYNDFMVFNGKHTRKFFSENESLLSGNQNSALEKSFSNIPHEYSQGAVTPGSLYHVKLMDSRPEEENRSMITIDSSLICKNSGNDDVFCNNFNSKLKGQKILKKRGVFGSQRSENSTKSHLLGSPLDDDYQEFLDDPPTEPVRYHGFNAAVITEDLKIPDYFKRLPNLQALPNSLLERRKDTLHALKPSSGTYRKFRYSVKSKRYVLDKKDVYDRVKAKKYLPYKGPAEFLQESSFEDFTLPQKDDFSYINISSAMKVLCKEMVVNHPIKKVICNGTIDADNFHPFHSSANNFAIARQVLPWFTTFIAGKEHYLDTIPNSHMILRAQLLQYAYVSLSMTNKLLNSNRPEILVADIEEPDSGSDGTLTPRSNSSDENENERKKQPLLFNDQDKKIEFTANDILEGPRAKGIPEELLAMKFEGRGYRHRAGSFTHPMKAELGINPSFKASEEHRRIGRVMQLFLMYFSYVERNFDHPEDDVHLLLKFRFLSDTINNLRLLGTTRALEAHKDYIDSLSSIDSYINQGAANMLIYNKFARVSGKAKTDLLIEWIYKGKKAFPHSLHYIKSVYESRATLHANTVESYSLTTSDQYNEVLFLRRVQCAALDFPTAAILMQRDWFFVYSIMFFFWSEYIDDKLNITNLKICGICKAATKKAFMDVLSSVAKEDMTLLMHRTCASCTLVEHQYRPKLREEFNPYLREIETHLQQYTSFTGESRKSVILNMIAPAFKEYWIQRKDTEFEVKLHEVMEKDPQFHITYCSNTDSVFNTTLFLYSLRELLKRKHSRP